MAVIPERPEALEDIQPREIPQLWKHENPDEVTALKIAIQDMETAELFISPHLWRWNSYDLLYLFRVPIAFWEGTDKARAHLGVPLVYEHTESLLPQVINTLFLDDPPFLLKPLPGTSMDTARANSAILSTQLRQTEFQEQVRLLSKSCLLYGMGIGKWGWMQDEESFRRAVRVNQPQTIDSIGGKVIIENDESDELEFVDDTRKINRPTFEALDIRHVFVDPSLRGPDIRKAKFVIHQAYMTIRQLDALREIEGYDIPDQKKLVSFFFPPKEHTPKSLASLTEFSQGQLNVSREFEPTQPEEEVSINPLDKPMEVIEYWSPALTLTILNRKIILRTETNQFGAIPFVSCTYSDLLNKFYGIGVAQLIGPEQRLQQGIINSRLDDLALSLTGMFTRVRGSNSPTQQIRMRPGGVIDMDIVDGVKAVDRRPAVPEAFAEVSASDARAQRRTGANELITQGSLPDARTSITRTATGIGALTAGTGARIQYFLMNLSKQVIVPVIESFTNMNRTRLKPSQIQEMLNEELGEVYTNNALDILNGRFRFETLVAAKLQARQSMAQSLPLMFQFLVNEPVIQALTQEGKKLNFSELANMTFDVSGWPNKNDLIVPMTEEDLQRQQQNSPGAQQAALQEQQSNLKSEEAARKIESQAGRDILKSKIKEAEDARQS